MNDSTPHCKQLIVVFEWIIISFINYIPLAKAFPSWDHNLYRNVYLQSKSDFTCIGEVMNSKIA